MSDHDNKSYLKYLKYKRKYTVEKQLYDSFGGVYPKWKQKNAIEDGSLVLPSLLLIILQQNGPFGQIIYPKQQVSYREYLASDARQGQSGHFHPSSSG